MGKRKTNTDYINESNIVHSHEYDYSLINYINNKTKIKIICKKHGVFEQIPQNHLRGQGCPLCYGKNKHSDVEFIKKSNKIHKDLYDYSLVNYVNSHSKVNIICKKHGVFEQRPNDHLNSRGCPKCNNKNVTTEEFIIKSNIIHNNKFIYTDIYTNNKTKIKIICKKHGEFFQKPNDHLNGNGCPYCGGTKKLTNEIIIKRSNKTHNNKYDYSLINYINNKTKIKIICPLHGIFKQSPLHHMNGVGCPKCNMSKGEKSIKYYLDLHKIIYSQQKIFDGCKYKRKLKFDFHLPEYNTCIEYDGEQHFKRNHYFNTKKNYENQKMRDNIKTIYCSSNKIKLIRINYLDNIENKINKLIKS